MIGRFCDWLDDRTGYRHWVNETLYEPIPGGARWRYVWGSTLVFTFFVQVVTGVFLWSAYAPSAQTAWESVFYIQHYMWLGHVVRGLHHYAAQAMVVLMAIHLIQVVIDGAYRAPREINFWLGLLLMQVILGLSLTGYLLPWDQKGYYATQVSTKILGATPQVGPALQLLAQGGPEYGHHTLTRFFAMHAGVFPGLLITFLALHIYVFRRHGITVADSSRGPTTTFWPDQVFRDCVACLVVLAVVLSLALWRGVELNAPANPAEAFSAARPEWYFLFLFRFLRFEAVEHFGLAFGAIYVPAALMLLVGLMPLVALVKGGHRFNVGVLVVLALGIVGLTALAMYEDGNDPQHQLALLEARRDGERAVELASQPTRIPVEGANALLRDDPFTQGPRLFARHCASCHRYDGHNGRGALVYTVDPKTRTQQIAEATAPDLRGFASRAWWRDILMHYDRHAAVIARSGFDVDTSAEEGMLSWFQESQEVLHNPVNAPDVAAMIEFLAAQSGRDDLDLDAALVERGQEVIATGELTSGTITTCDSCHAGVGEDFELGTDNGGIPELNGYGSYAWLAAFVHDPGTPQFYGDKNRMPSFADRLTEKQMDLLVRYFIDDYLPSHAVEYPSRRESVDTPTGEEDGQ